MAMPIQSFTFWINAFVPRDIFRATAILREGEYRGLSILTRRPCYLTDQRDFSNDRRALARMQSLVTVHFKKSNPTLLQWHRCDQLIQCDLVSGDVKELRQGNTSEMKFALTATVPTVAIRMDCKYAAAPPVPAHGIGEIEYRGTIEIDPTKGRTDIDLMICLFPAFEAYLSVNDRPVEIVFRHSPPPGILALGPPRGAMRRIRWTLEDNGDSQSPNADFS